MSEYKSNIPKLMDEANVSRMDLVRKLNVSYDTANKIYKGDLSLRLTNVLSVCYYLGIGLDEAISKK